MKKMSKSVMIWSVIILSIFIANRVEAQTNAYPIRNLTLDTLGKTVYLNEDEPNRDGTLIEYTNDQVVKTWKIKYEQKGSSRMLCKPPVINVSFDKTTSKGKSKELFTGVSTYDGYSSLQYQKVRMIPECDIWNDYWRHTGDVGFGGQLNVNLREYIIFKIFRAFGIPVADIIGFANVTFVSPDSGYEGKTFRYMIVQRPSELDDQIPFTKQYNLNPQLFESDGQWHLSTEGDLGHSSYKRLVEATIVNNTNNTTQKILFDEETTIKFLLLTEFLNVSDMGFLHNEEGGVDLNSGKTKIIPHGFDASFACNGGYFSVQNSVLFEMINSLPDNVKQKYQSLGYKITRDIFGTKSSLDRMISLVNDFPYQDVDKSKLIDFLRIKFYEYAKYSNSFEFADLLEQNYKAENIYLPFESENEYLELKQKFYNSCNPEPKEVSNLIVTIVDNPTVEISNRESDQVASVKFTAEVSTGDTPVQILKESAFVVRLVGENSNFEREVSFVSYGPLSGTVIDNVGPYYELPPRSKGRFGVTLGYNSKQMLRDSYVVKVESFTPNRYIKPINFDIKSDKFNFGSIQPIKFVNPESDRDLIIGNNIKISWQGGSDTQRMIMLIRESERGGYYISDPNNNILTGSKEYDWKIGDIQVFDPIENWKTSSVEPGKYKLSIIDVQTGLKFESGFFNIVPYADYKSPKIDIIGTSTLTAKLDNSGSEEILESKFTVLINAGSKDQKIHKKFAFNTYLSKDSGEYGMYNQSNVINVDGQILDGGEFYIIQAGTDVTFKIRSYFNPKVMFAGVYVGVLNSIVLGDFSNPNIVKFANKNITNTLVVIGEKSPYVDSISPRIIPANEIITIKGVRFSISDPNTVNLASLISNCPEGFTCTQDRKYSVVSKDGTTLEFVSNIVPGDYRVQVTHPIHGASNIVGITVSTSTAPSTQAIIPDKETASSGQIVKLNYSIPARSVSAKLMLYCPEGVVGKIASKDMCNQWLNFPTLPIETDVIFINKSDLPQYVVPNFYIYYENDPNYAIGVSSQVKVLPQLTSNTPAPTPAPILGDGILSKVIDNSRKVVEPTLRRAVSIIIPTQITPPPTIFSPTPSPVTNSTASVSPSPNQTIKPSSSVTPKPSATITPSFPTSSSTPTPSPTEFRCNSSQCAVAYCPSGTSVQLPLGKRGNYTYTTNSVTYCSEPYSSFNQYPYTVSNISVTNACSLSKNEAQRLANQSVSLNCKTPSPTPSITITPTPTIMPTITITPTPTTSPTPTTTFIPTPTITITPTPTIIVTPTPTPTTNPSSNPTSTTSPPPISSPSSSPSTSPSASLNQNSLASVFEAITEWLGWGR